MSYTISEQRVYSWGQQNIMFTGMLTPEFFVIVGLLVVIFAALALWVASGIRDWFFEPELKERLAITQD
jgi:hypothetical protein